MQYKLYEEKREIIYKQECETDYKYGKPPEERTIEELLNKGIVNINKPRNPTSHKVVDYVKKILNIEKAGHSGTLDPKATGVLPIALGKATRVLEFLQKSSKEYVGIAYLHRDIDYWKIKEGMKEFVGVITQIPPVRSAVKRRPRKRKVYYFDILEKEGRWVLFIAGVEHGVYIRKLIHDLGIKLGIGMHMYNLHRTRVGYFSYKNYNTLQELEKAYEEYINEGKEKNLKKIIKPYEFGVYHLKRVWVHDKAVGNIAYGAQVYIPGICHFEKFNKGEFVGIFSLKNELVAVGKALLSWKDLEKKHKGMAIKIKKVFIERDIYPR